MITVAQELQRDLELERRKVLTLQDSLKEREKEYQKLKVGCFWTACTDSQNHSCIESFLVTA